MNPPLRPAIARDFSAIRAAMQRYVDQDLLAGVSWAVLSGREALDVQCLGWADKEAGGALREDTIFRAFSNTKLVTTCAAMLLLEEGRFQLDDPIEHYIPQLGNRRVLRPGATRIDDSEPARSPITVRQLLSHSSGLSYGLLDPGSLIFQAYSDRQVLSPLHSLAQQMDVLADLPLVAHPGTTWEYSVATDVLARLVEVLSGQALDTFLRSRILDTLEMADTHFFVPPAKHPRLAAMYAGADMTKPLVPGLTPEPDWPYPGAFTTPVPHLSGGAGLATTLPDMLALVRSLMPGGKTLLQPQTIALMMRNQLPEGSSIRFPTTGPVPGKVFGLGGALTKTPGRFDPANSAGEFEWGGIGGTHWWFNPRLNIAGIVMTQRKFGFWHPHAFEFKRLAYAALGH